jgi:coproporphyrinogen III oxidase-like Fe-S oxidoreductase
MEALEVISKSGFNLDQVSIDLMMGVPHQTIATYKQSLEKALSYGFGHLSFYILTLEENTPFHKKYKADLKPLPSTDEIVDMYNLTHDLLVESHYDHYEISNYGKPQSHSRHN